MGAANLRDRFLAAEMLKHLEVIQIVARKGRKAVEAGVEARYALEHATELLAEAAKHTSAEFRTANSDIDWTRVRALRRAVAHPYDHDASEANFDLVWVFARDLAPELARGLRRPKFSRSL